MDPNTKKNVNEWLEGDYDDETKCHIRKIAEESPSELVDAFYQHLNFGTGGLRGIMGVGTNRMNCYTVRAAAQGLANYVLKCSEIKDCPRFIIGYDPRKNSRFFAEETAKVLAANGIEALMFDNVRPTPLVSFGCRYKECTGGIMITASHNPPEYNGIKIYWSDGGQVLSPHDAGIIKEANAITSLSEVNVAETFWHPLIKEVAADVEEAYYDAIEQLQSNRDINRKYGKKLHIIYTNLHGTGITLIPETMKRWGFTNIGFVEEQLEPDGGFPTTDNPNPEERQALELGIRMLENKNADILIANDPDADRMGVAINHKNKVRLLSGNEIACLCLEHLCATRHAQNSLPDDAAFIKSIVTTDLFREIAQSYNRPCFDTLTGFKYIAKLISEWETDENQKHQFLFGAEESYGFLLGTQSRDKDGISAAALICEAALNAKIEGKTLIDRLEDLYNRYGVYFEKIHALKFPESKEGHEKMRQGMQVLKNTTIRDIAGVPITSIEDYSLSTRINCVTDTKEPINLPKTEMLTFHLKDKSKIVIRPSGTEPKVKIYCSVVKQKGCFAIEETIAICEMHSNRLIDSIVRLLYQNELKN